MKSGVYCIKNLANGKVYIGSTKSLHRRRREHFARLRRGDHESPLLQLAFVEYGELAFQFSILQLADADGLIAAEQLFLDSSRAADPRFGYNSRPKADSNSGRVFSEEFRAKVRAANIGKKQSAETRAKRSAAMMGRKMSIEAVLKSALARTGKPRPDIAIWAPEKLSLFNRDQVLAIRADRVAGMTYRALAKKHQCNVSTAHLVVNSGGAFYSQI